jgi:hypothetical protein
MGGLRALRSCQEAPWPGRIDRVAFLSGNSTAAVSPRACFRRLSSVDKLPSGKAVRARAQPLAFGCFVFAHFSPSFTSSGTPGTAPALEAAPNSRFQ